MIGQRFGKLVVIPGGALKITPQRGNAQYRCRCECGDERTYRARDLRSGKVTSCYRCKKRCS